MENPFCFAYTVTDFINAIEAGIVRGIEMETIVPAR